MSKTGLRWAFIWRKMNRWSCASCGYFEAVARYGGFTRAAEQLHVAQSAVSAQIRAAGGRARRPAVRPNHPPGALTEAGELFLHRVRRAFAELDARPHRPGDLAAVLSGRVTIGATAVLGGFDLPGALARFHTRYPGVTLSLRSGLIADLLTAARRGRRRPGDRPGARRPAARVLSAGDGRARRWC